MPMGSVSIIPTICHRLSVSRPKHALDLGSGFGLWGALVRQYVDNGVQPYGTRLVGVEGFEGYRNPNWEHYDRVHVTAIETFLANAESTYGAILLLDVIEHFEKQDGDRVLELAEQRLAKGGELFVATPAIWMEQGAAYGNELERHRSLWTADEFRALGFDVLMDGSPDVWGNQMILAVKKRGE